MAYYRRIRDMREDHDLPQRQLAALLHMPQPQYNRYGAIPFCRHLRRGKNDLSVKSFLPGEHRATLRIPQEEALSLIHI